VGSKANVIMEGFRANQRLGVEWLEATPFAKVSWLVHGFSTRRWTGAGTASGDLNLAREEGPAAAAIRANRERFVAAIGDSGFELASVRQIHSDRIFEVASTKDSEWSYVMPGCPPSDVMPPECKGDALITKRAGILLCVRTADCMPILLADLRNRAVAAVHAGWRGTLKRIVEKAAGELRRVFGSRPNDLLAAVGPAIGACCYAIGREVADAFSGAFANADDFIVRTRSAVEDPRKPLSPSFLSRFPPGHGPAHEGSFKLNLQALARHQLESVGIPRANISMAGECTFCRNDRYFSYRKEGSHAGRMMAVIGVRSGSAAERSLAVKNNLKRS
jgi:purine-nucleoside/S-methyl-5'-thioadenosine phosphorylase / adenosine deaminase